MSHSNIKRIFIILTSLLAQTISKSIPEHLGTTNPTFNIGVNNTLTNETNNDVTENDLKAVEYYLKQDQKVIDNLNREAEQKIQVLEKRKEELFVELNTAIDSAVQALREGDNDTTTAEGIEHLTKLKEQIKELNEASNEDDDYENKEPSRRAGAGKDQLEEPEINEDFLLRSMWTISNQDHRHKKKDDIKRDKYREGVKDRLDVWLSERIKLKKERKDRDLMLGNEKCPKYGQEGKKKYKPAKKKGKRYPCCKKCCKQSIVKCL